MTDPVLQPRSLLADSIGLRLIAAVQIVEAIGLVAAIAALWNSEDPGGSFVEAFVWVLLTVVLLVVAWGLWSRRAWAWLFALILYWPIFSGAVLLFVLSLYVHFLVPSKGGIEVVRGLAAMGLFSLPAVMVVSGGTLWCLHRRTR